MFRKSMNHAIDGIIFAIKNERNFRIHLVILVLTISGGLFFKITTTEWLFIIVISSMVLLAELINTAIEKTLDWLEPNHHTVIKTVKDICAGAVLISAIGALIMGLIIFLPYIINFIQHL